MTDQITLEEALELVSFEWAKQEGCWQICEVNGDIYGHVNGAARGDIRGYVGGDVEGDIGGHVCGHVCGDVGGTISGLKWQFAENPNEEF